MPQVSVILPTYNRAHLLLRAVRSVLAQDFDDFELWIIDDESVDNTADVVATINDPRVHYERIAHRGFAGAMNRGLELSRGKYLAFIDSDDEWVPTKLQRQVAVLDSQGPEVGVVYTAGRSFDDVRGRSGGIHHVRIEGVGWLFERLLERPGGIPFPSVLVRRECFARVGHFDETLPVCQDREWLLRVTRQFALYGLPEPLIIGHEHEGPHLGHDIGARIAFEEVLLVRYAEELGARPRAHAQMLMRMGGLRLAVEDRRGARRDFLRAVRILPSHLPAYFYFSASLLGRRGSDISTGIKRALSFARRH